MTTFCGLTPLEDYYRQEKRYNRHYIKEPVETGQLKEKDMSADKSKKKEEKKVDPAKAKLKQEKREKRLKKLEEMKKANPAEYAISLTFKDFKDTRSKSTDLELAKKIAWSDYCDYMAASYKDYWEARKKNAPGTPKDETKRQAAIDKLEARLKKLKGE